MPRMNFPHPDTMDAAQRRVYDKVVSGPRGKVVGPLRAALHSPELADRWQALGQFLRYDTTLTRRQSEMAILVTARACQSPFEWYAHEVEALKVGVEPEVIAALLAQRMPDGLPPDERLVVQVAQELNHERSIGHATYEKAKALFGDRMLVELTALVGYYTMVAMTLNAHEIPLPQGVLPAFPLPQDLPQDLPR
jgi:4-carboxymuconolactone decarboxylase